MSANWYTLSIIALFFIGTQRFLYKISVQRGCNAAVTTFTFMGTVTCISFVLLLFSDTPLGPISSLVFISLVNSISFTLATLTHMETLKYLPVNVAYPIIRLNLALVVIFSVLFFGDSLSVWQIAGIFVAIFAILILAKSPDTRETGVRDIRRGFLLLTVCVLSGAVASISSKFAAMETNKLAFITLSYLLGTSFAFALRNRVSEKKADSRNRDAVMIGICMALLNLVGFYLFLLALDRGPLSIVVSIISLHFVIPIVLSAIFYSEKLRKIHFIGIGLTVVSVIFLRM